MISLQKPFRSNSSLRNMKGLTLVELLVAMLLGLFLMGGVISVFLSNQQNFKTNENLASMQENARFSFEQLSREIRDAGTNPCGVRAVNSVVRSGATIPWWGDWNAGTIRGYDGAESVAGSTVTFGTSVENRVSATDALVVLRTTNNDNVLRTVASHTTTPGFENFTFNAAARLSKQDLLFVCDSISGAIFEASNPAAGLNTNVSYDASAPSSNCSTALGWSTATNCITSSITKTFTAGSVITKFDPGIWYIGTNADSGRSLFRETVHKRLAPSAIIITERREMVPDVHDMQIQYLMRTNPSSTATGTATIPVLATDWVDASTVNAQAGAWSSANLQEAIAVKIELTFRSKDAVGTDGVASVKLERKTIAVINLRSRELQP